MTHVPYMTVRLPEDLVAQVDDMVQNNHNGYSSRAEFVKEAIRLRLEEIIRHQSRVKR